MSGETTEWVEEADDTAPRGGVYKALVAWCGECGWRSAVAQARDSQALMESQLELHRERYHQRPDLSHLPEVYGSTIAELEANVCPGTRRRPAAVAFAGAWCSVCGRVFDLDADGLISSHPRASVEYPEREGAA